MKWFLISFFLIFLYWLFLKNGKIDFWKLAQKNADQFFDFIKNEPSFIYFREKPKELPSGDWDGPFLLFVPKLGTRLFVYGKHPDYQKRQDYFFEKMKNHKEHT